MSVRDSAAGRMGHLVQRPRNRQNKRRNVRIKTGAVFGDHLITAMHRADRGFENGARGVLVAFTRMHHRLFADDAITTYFAHVTIRVGDDPVTAQQACADRSPVMDLDRVRENVTIVMWCRLIVEKLRLDRNRDVVGFITGHGVIVGECAAWGKHAAHRVTAQRARICSLLCVIREELSVQGVSVFDSESSTRANST